MEHLNEEAVRHLCRNTDGMVTVLGLSLATMIALTLALLLGYL